MKKSSETRNLIESVDQSVAAAMEAVLAAKFPENGQKDQMNVKAIIDPLASCLVGFADNKMAVDAWTTAVIYMGRQMTDSIEIAYKSGKLTDADVYRALIHPGLTGPDLTLTTEFKTKIVRVVSGVVEKISTKEVAEKYRLSLIEGLTTPLPTNPKHPEAIVERLIRKREMNKVEAQLSLNPNHKFRH